MGEVGRDDPELLRRFKEASESALRRELLDELLRIHTPLLTHIVAQLTGLVPGAGGMFVVGARDVHGDDRISWGYRALTKALEQFDPARGTKLSTYLKSKVRHELQRAVEQHSIVKVDIKKARTLGISFSYTRIENDEHLDFLTGGELAVDGADEDEDEDLVDVKPHARPVPLRSEIARPALELLLEEHCRFSPSARVASRTLRGRYAAIACELGEPFVVSNLLTALRHRGARRTTMRTPWSHAAEAFAGVDLQASEMSPASFEGGFTEIPTLRTWRRT
jgi:hypothetical protein